MDKLKQLIIDEVKKYEWDKIDGVIDSIIPNIMFSLDAELSEKTLDSRFGGRPAVPEGFEWPRVAYGENAPYAFFFQLNYKDIKPSDIDNVLPEKGLLLCFAGVVDDLMYERSKESFKVYYFPEPNDFQLLAAPTDLSKDQILDSRSLSFKTSYQLPAYPFHFKNQEDESISNEDADGIDDVWGEIQSEAITSVERAKFAKAAGMNFSSNSQLNKVYSHNQILGNPMSVQHYVSCEWAEEHFGEDVDDDFSEDEEAVNYINIISFEMKGREGLGFGDNVAHLYLCMHREDLKTGNFEKVIAIVQNT